MHNLALANHLSGLQTQCKVRLQRAVKYYELSYKLEMMQQAAVNICFVHAMSVLNNIGTIYRLLDEQEASTKFFQHLLSNMAFLRETGEACPLEHSWGGLWSNVTSLLLRNSCTARAA
jgi:hypothetical protein